MFLWVGGGCSLAFGAVDFDGTDDYVEKATPNSALDISASFTISCWVNLEALPISSSWFGVVVKVTVPPSGVFNYMLLLDGGALASGGVGWLLATDGNVFPGAKFSTTPNLNQWYHIAGTYTEGSDTFTIYVDGIQQAQASAAGYPPTGTAPFLIGVDPSTAGTNFNGIIDDVRIYNRALSPSEVEVIAKGRLKYDSLTTPGNGLVGYWPLDDSPDGTSGDGDTFVDRSGNGNNGTGVDGANNTGLTAKASSYLMYPAPVQ